MRHRKSGKHLNRTSSHRKAMFSNMSASLIEHESIQTTVVKAKELRRYVEPLITLGKTDTVANRRRAFSKLRSKSAVGKLFTELGPRYSERPGGYTKILKAGFRQGDASGIAYMQLVDAQLATKSSEEDEQILDAFAETPDEDQVENEKQASSEVEVAEAETSEESTTSAEAEAVDAEVVEKSTEVVADSEPDATAEESSEAVSSDETSNDTTDNEAVGDQKPKE